MILLVAAKSACSQTRQVSNSPQAWLLELIAPGYICINSSIPRTIYSIGYFPDGARIRTSQQAIDEIEYTDQTSITQDNTVFFAVSSGSSIELYSDAGNVSIAAIGLGLSNCSDGIAVTNQVSGQNIKDIMLSISTHKCIFFGVFGSGNVDITPVLKESDKLNYVTGSSGLNSLSRTNSDTATTNGKTEPVFVYIDTTNEEIHRSIKFDVNIDPDSKPKYQVMVEEKMTPTPVPVPTTGTGPNTPEIIGIVVGCIAFLVIFVGLIVYLFRKRKGHIENATSSSAEPERYKSIEKRISPRKNDETSSLKLY